MAHYYSNPHAKKGKKWLGFLFLGLLVLGSAYTIGAGVNGWKFNPTEWNNPADVNTYGVKVKAADAIDALKTNKPAEGDAVAVGYDSAAKLDSKILDAVKNGVIFSGDAVGSGTYVFYNSHMMLETLGTGSAFYQKLEWAHIANASAEAASSAVASSAVQEKIVSRDYYDAVKGTFGNIASVPYAGVSANLDGMDEMEKVVLATFIADAPASLATDSNKITDVTLSLTEGVYGAGALKGVRRAMFTWNYKANGAAASMSFSVYSVINVDYSDMKFDTTKATVGDYVIPSALSGYFNVKASA